MKNKTFISFFINLLIGIIFGFPVVYDQNCSGFDFPLATSESVNGIQIGTNDLILHNSVLLGIGRSQNKFSSVNLFKRKITAGEKGNDGVYSPNLIARFIIFSNQNSVYTNHLSNFVNLSFLKELRITKMLC